MKQIFLLSAVLIFAIAGMYHAQAYSIDFENCDHAKCFEYAPQNNTSFETTTPNWAMYIHLPTWGNTDNSVVTILSDNNMTALKNNVGIIAVENIHTTNESPNTNYCPLAKFVLTHEGEPEYLNKLYDITKGIDLTGYVYPAYCHVETGPNPVNGDDSIVSVPEFPIAAIILVAIFSGVILLGRMVDGHWAWQFGKLK